MQCSIVMILFSEIVNSHRLPIHIYFIFCYTHYNCAHTFHNYILYILIQLLRQPAIISMHARKLSNHFFLNFFIGSNKLIKMRVHIWIERIEFRFKFADGTLIYYRAVFLKTIRKWLNIFFNHCVFVHFYFSHCSR